MKSFLTFEEFVLRIPQSAILPHVVSDDGEDVADTARIETALQDATGIICARLLWLKDDEGKLKQPVAPKFADALYAMCADITLARLTDTVSGTEDERNRYNDMMKLLSEINSEYKGSLCGPGEQSASVVVVPDESEGIPDTRFFKKGRLF